MTHRHILPSFLLPINGHAAPARGQGSCFALRRAYLLVPHLYRLRHEMYRPSHKHSDLFDHVGVDILRRQVPFRYEY